MNSQVADVEENKYPDGATEDPFSSGNAESMADKLTKVQGGRWVSQSR